MKKRIAAGIPLAFLLLGPRPAAADTVTIPAMKDNTLCESLAALSNGAGEFFYVGQTNDGLTRRGVIAFDVAGQVPAGSTIDAVTLTLNLSKTRAGQETVRLHRLNLAWGEGTSNQPPLGFGNCGAATIGDATWAHSIFDTAFWATAGGDFSIAISASQTVGDNTALGPHTWGSTAEMVANVQGWLDAPAANFGWILIGNETGSRTSKRFDSRENATAANRPALQVDFTPPAVGPTVYESTAKDKIGNPVGNGPSPYNHPPAAGSPLFYQVDDGLGVPAVIFVVKLDPAVSRIQITW